MGVFKYIAVERQQLANLLKAEMTEEQKQQIRKRIVALNTLERLLRGGAK